MKLMEAIKIARGKYKWLAIDKNGDICGYLSKPTSYGGEVNAWLPDYCGYTIIGEHTGTPIDWRKSLIKLTSI